MSPVIAEARGVLGQRRWAVLKALGEGKTYNTILEESRMDPKTYRKDIRFLMGWFDVDSIEELGIIAYVTSLL